MDHVGPVLAKQFCDVSMRIRRPHRMLRELQATYAGVLFRLPVIAAIDNDFVPGALQERTLLLKDNVFATGLLVRTVDEEDLHRLRIGCLGSFASSVPENFAVGYVQDFLMAGNVIEHLAQLIP